MHASYLDNAVQRINHLPAGPSCSTTSFPGSSPSRPLERESGGEEENPGNEVGLLRSRRSLAGQSWPIVL